MCDVYMHVQSVWYVFMVYVYIVYNILYVCVYDMRGVCVCGHVHACMFLQGGYFLIFSK